MSNHEIYLKYRQIMKSSDKEAIELINTIDDINAPDEDGYRLIDHLLDLKRHSYSAVLNALLVRGARYSLRNGDGWLRYSIKYMSGSELKLFLDAGADPNQPSNKLSPLNYVISHTTGNQQTEMVSHLLVAGADPNIQGYGNDRYLLQKNYSTALICALTQKNINFDVIVELVNSGADASIADCEGYTCIYYALRAKKFEVFPLLIKAGGDVNNLGPKAGHPLSYLGSGAKVPQHIENLLHLGIDFTMLGDVGFTHVLSNSKAVELLIAHGASPDSQILRLACSSGLDKSVEVLVRSGANIHEKNEIGQSPIFNALRQPKVLKILIRCGASIDDPDQHGQTPLMVAIDNGYLESAQILIKHGADVSAITSTGDSLLHRICRGGKYGVSNNNPEISRIITLLIKSGQRLDATNIEGMTPLMYAAQGYGLFELLNHGPELDLQNASGKTALMLAAEKCERAGELKQNAGKQCGTCIVRDCGSNVTQLLATGAKRDILDKSGRSALDYASQRSFEILNEIDVLKTPDSTSLMQLIKQHKDCNSPRDFIDFLEDLAGHIKTIVERLDIQESIDFANELERVHKSIEHAQWGMEMRTRKVPTSKLNRCGDIYLGPIFVSSAHPWPQKESQYLLPLLQINLRKISQLLEIEFGSGILQLWGVPNSFDDFQIRILPEDEVSPQSLDPNIPSSILEIDEKIVKMIPLNWLPQFDGMSWQITEYRNKHFSFHYDWAEFLCAGLDDDPEDEFTLSMLSRAAVMDKSYAPRSNSIGGTFYPIQYGPDEKPPVLVDFSDYPYGWGSDGNAQIFYEKQVDGTSKYSFDWSCG